MLAQGVFEVLRLHLQNFGPIRLCASRGHDDSFFAFTTCANTTRRAKYHHGVSNVRYRTLGGTLHRVHAVLSRELIWSVEPPPLRQASTSRGHPALAFFAGILPTAAVPARKK